MAVHRLQLLPTEEVLVDIRPHWAFLTAPLFTALVVVAVGVSLDVAIPHTSVDLHWVEGVVVAIPCLWLAMRVVRWQTTAIVLTSLRLIKTWGVFSRRQWEVRLVQIESVTVVQSLIRRALGTGRLEVAIWDDDQVHFIDDVQKPVILQRVINRRLRPYGQQAGEPGGPGSPGGPGGSAGF